MTYEIIRSNRKTISIQIRADGQIVVRCPRQMRSEEVKHFVESKEVWIQRHLSKVNSRGVQPLTRYEIELLRKQVKEMVTERVAHYAALMDVSYGRITVRTQKTRWGSCSSKGNLNFNCLLALVPPDVLDYVVVHELCHLKEMNHSKQFWEKVGKILPDYDQSKRWLNDNGSNLIARL